MHCQPYLTAKVFMAGQSSTNSYDEGLDTTIAESRDNRKPLDSLTLNKLMLLH